MWNNDVSYQPNINTFFPLDFKTQITERMAKLMIVYGDVGRVDAIIDWVKCKDLDQKSTESIKLKKQRMDHLNKLTSIERSLGPFLDRSEQQLLRMECEKFKSDAKQLLEEEIEIKHRPTHVFFNNKAIINLTNERIPDDILLGLSFGPKFLFPFVCKDDNILEILAILDLTISNSIDESRQLITSKEIMHHLKKQNRLEESNEKQWLMFIYNRMVEFFKRNKQIFATRSDKGGHVVIIDQTSYENKLHDLLNNDSYSIIQTNPLENLVRKESNFINKLKKEKNIKNIMKTLPPFEPNTLGLAKFYGLVKIHKENKPLRPITAMIGSVGYSLSKIFDKMLNTVFPRTKHHIKDTYEFVEFIKTIKIDKEDRLISFDVVSMYTSIPIDLVKEIVLSKSNEFLELYSLNRADLIAIIDFLLIECTAFTALGHIYKQLSGLPMGSCISPTLARLSMDKVIDRLKQEIPQIRFIKVFVDDTIAAMNPLLVDKAMAILNGFKPNQIKFTKEFEQQDGSINFLNVTLKRHYARIQTFWYKKHFSSGRLLNFYSAHKRSIILSTAVHFIKTVLILTDPSAFHKNKSMIIQTLRENSFPETLIMKFLHSEYTYMKPLSKRVNSKPHNFYSLSKYTGITKTINKQEQKSKKYIPFPHAIYNTKQIKEVLHHNKMPHIVLADSVKNTKLNVVKTIKTKTPTMKKKNLILLSVCKCGKKIRISNTKFNETGEMAMKRMITKHRLCKEQLHTFKTVKFKRGLFYSNQTEALLRFIQWKYRHKLDGRFEYEFPNYYLLKLVPNKD